MIRDDENSDELLTPHQPNRWVRSSYSADVSIIIVNFNTRGMLARALASIDASHQQSSLEIIVIDNASRDGSVEMLQSDFPHVRCVANDLNLGHTEACNQGISISGGRYVFLLNSDTCMQSGAIDVLVSYLDQQPRAGAVGPKVLNADGTIQGTIKQFPTPWAALFGRFSLLTRMLPNNRFSRQYLVYLDQDFSRPFAVDSISGAALMVRREAIEAAGLLDPQFFLYWNDVDWCRSIWKSGFEVHCVPESVLMHEEHHGGSRNGAWRRLRTVVNFHRGAYLYYRKWHVRRFWQPSHLLALSGLSLRAAVVLVFDQLSWFFPSRRTD